MAGTWGDFLAGRGTWVSQGENVSTATSQASGVLTFVQTTPAGASVAWYSRSSPDNATWSAWAAVNGDGTLASPANTYVQIKAVLVGVAGNPPGNLPTVASATLTFDGTPSATALNGAGVTWTAGGFFTFTTFQDLAIICNGLNPPAQYDGTTLSLVGGSPPAANYQAVHQNRLWLAHSGANPSRIWFSDLLNQSSWPALNFIDVSPKDGDQIRGVLEFGNVIAVWKDHSVWAIEGDTTLNYSLVRIHAGVGAIAPASPAIVELQSRQYLAWVSDVGVYFSDLNQPILATRRLQPDWDALNLRKINVSAAGYFKDMLYVSVPSGSASAPDTTYLFDALRNCWDKRPGWAFSCYATFRESGKEKLLIGDASVGQVYELTGTTDLGATVPFQFETKAETFGAAERLKRCRRILIEARANNAAGSVQVKLRPDLGALTSALAPQAVPNDGKLHTLLVYPSQVGVVNFHTLGVNIQELASTAQTEIHSVAFEVAVKQARAS